MKRHTCQVQVENVCGCQVISSLPQTACEGLQGLRGRRAVSINSRGSWHCAVFHSELWVCVGLSLGEKSPVVELGM